MTSTATEPTTTTDQPATVASKPAAPKTTVTRKPATSRAASPAKPVTAKPVTTAQLESMAGGFIAAGTQAGMSLVDILCELHKRSAWQEHTMPVGAYFIDVIGIGSESGFVLPKTARQALVKKMAGVDGVQNSTLAQMTGASLRTIANDRAELGVASKTRQDGQNKSDGETDGEETGETDGDDKPAAPRKPRVQTINVIEIVDGLNDAGMLTAIMQHAAMRLAALNTPADVAA
jgi:hypothetical protein